MTKQQIKSEIQQVLDKMPEAVLKDILDHLKQLEAESNDQLELSHNLNKILREDRELLEKLAQ